jgi:hypothetical protein
VQITGEELARAVRLILTDLRRTLQRFRAHNAPHDVAVRANEFRELIDDPELLTWKLADGMQQLSHDGRLDSTGLLIDGADAAQGILLSGPRYLTVEHLFDIVMSSSPTEVLKVRVSAMEDSSYQGDVLAPEDEEALVREIDAAHTGVCRAQLRWFRAIRAGGSLRVVAGLGGP